VTSPLGVLAVAALAALLVAVATLAARRWGHGVGGVLSAFPLIVGPVLLIAAERHGPAFAAEAAAATLAGLVALAGFALAYAWAAARRRSWAASLLAAWAVAAALGLAAGGAGVGLIAATASAALAIAVARAGLPAAAPARLPERLDAWDLPLRMALTALLIVALTAAANAFGPVAAGALSALPTLASVLAVFTHRLGGHDAVVELLRGMVEGMVAFATFCAVVGALVDRAGIAPAFLLATAAAVAVQAGIVYARHAVPAASRA
jgi:hypothetical protein